MSSSKKPVNNGIPGSPLQGEPVVYLAVGTLRRTHGVVGDILLDVLTDFPERLKPNSFLFVGDKKQQLKITRKRNHNEGLLLGFEGITNSEQAAKYRAQTVYVLASNRPSLPDGEYYYHQILGLHVVDENEEALGVITDIIETGANDVYVITSERIPSKEILIPALKQVILDVNLNSKVMRVHLLPGLVDDDDRDE